MQRLKIVVTGAFNAGKTQLIKTISEIPVVSTEKRVSDQTSAIKPMTTAALDFGRVGFDDQTMLYLYGTPGQERFDFMWSALAKGMRGLLLMVDSTRPHTFGATRHIINFFSAISQVPTVVAANKQDDPDALSPQAVHAALGLPETVPVLPCNALDPQPVRVVLGMLIGLIGQHTKATVDQSTTDEREVVLALRPHAPAPLSAVMLKESGKLHLSREGLHTLCGRPLSPEAMPMLVFGTSGCQTCARSARALGLVCTSCKRPLVRSNDGRRCLGCAYSQRHQRSDDRAVIETLTRIDPSLA